MILGVLLSTIILAARLHPAVLLPAGYFANASSAPPWAMAGDPEADDCCRAVEMNAETAQCGSGGNAGKLEACSHWYGAVWCIKQDEVRPHTGVQPEVNGAMLHYTGGRDCSDRHGCYNVIIEGATLQCKSDQ